ncbi:MAG: hypothetical protein KDJ38_11590, partial [Gammaproteobacteria bacterium]|nr:hypothetical protein [Gammaproteobacteria bacterium]
AFRKNAIEEFQVIKFANKGSSSHTANMKLPDGRLLANAKEFIHSLPCFGIVERFNESIDLFERALPAEFPRIKFEKSVRANSLQDPSLSLDEKYEAVHQELGDELFQQVILRNQMDIKLYHYALGLFDRALG